MATNATRTALTPEEVQAHLKELLRTELNRIIQEQDRGHADIEDLDDRIAKLEAKAAHLRRDARQNDFSEIEDVLRVVAARVGVSLPDDIPVNLGRSAANLVRELHGVEADVLDGCDARAEAAPLVARHSELSVDEFVQSEPVLLSAAWEKTLELYPKKSMKGNIDAVGKLAIAFFGDIPVSTLTKDRQKDFFLFASRLPRNHGKTHGKNRFHPDQPKSRDAKYERTKADEIAEADDNDEAVTDEIRGMENLSNAEKRALLADRLTPRLTLQTLRRYRDSLNRLFLAAEELSSAKETPEVLSYKVIERAVAAAAPDDALYVRVTMSKIRMPWSEERLAAFLTSPIYTGCATPTRRWQPGNIIIRDAFYWVPLILLSIGSRIEEVVVLKRKNIILRNGIYCFSMNREGDQLGKTEDAQRIVPVPQILLDLGFIDWWKALEQDHGPLLFPDAVSRASTDDLSGPFSKAFKRLRDRLGVGDFDEDFYALRKTLSTLLNDAKVPENERQALAGHKRGSVLNLHYTAHRTKALKEAIDKADFGLSVCFSEVHGFPVIAGCGLSPKPAMRIEVELDDAGEAARIAVEDRETHDVQLFELRDRRTGERLRHTELLSAAGRFKKHVDDRPLLLPKNNLKRQVVEHFHALG